MCIYAVLQSGMKCLAHRVQKKKKRKKRQTRSSFDFSVKDVVEHGEQNNNSSTPAGTEDLFVHIQQVKRWVKHFQRSNFLHSLQPPSLHVCACVCVRSTKLTVFALNINAHYACGELNALQTIKFTVCM